jgi:site-specific DNA-methyltransferase (adenine-specific)
MNRKVMFSSANDNYKTPSEVYNKLNDEFHFDFDPCPLNDNPEFDGLEIEWGGG